MGGKISLADFTWFPTTVFMEFMLPRIFGWPNIFASGEDHGFPKLSKWWNSFAKQTHFAAVRSDILTFFEQKYSEGQFDSIIEEVGDSNFTWTYPREYSSSHLGNKSVELNYQADPPPGKKTGRYIMREDIGDLTDLVIPGSVVMHNARQLSRQENNLNTMGFTLAEAPSAIDFECFKNDDIEQINSLYYKEMADLVKRLSGAKAVFCFDHTVRESGKTNLNAASSSDSAALSHAFTAIILQMEDLDD